MASKEDQEMKKKKNYGPKKDKYKFPDMQMLGCIYTAQKKEKITFLMIYK